MKADVKKELWARGLCAVVSAALCYCLFSFLKNPPMKSFNVPVRVALKGVMRTTPTSASDERVAVLPLKSEKAPEARKARSKRLPSRPPPRPDSVEPLSPAPTPVQEQAPLKTLPYLPLEQPVDSGPAGMAGQDARAPTDSPPLIGAQELPGSQPVKGDFPLAAIEQPYGDVMVLGLLVNDRGTVVETKIVVPSRRGMTDLGYALAYQGQKWVNLEPPMLPGELRWLELRLDYKKILLDNESLP